MTSSSPAPTDMRELYHTLRQNPPTFKQDQTPIQGLEVEFFTSLARLYYRPGVAKGKSLFCFPVALRKPGELHLRLFWDYIKPLLLRLSCFAPNHVMLEKLPTEFLTIIPEVGHKNSIFMRRFDAGLVREGQLRLITAAWEGTSEQVRQVVESGLVGLKDEHVEALVADVHVAFMMGKKLLTKFLCSPVFRSERLEALMLRYLEREKVNADVVERLWEINYAFYFDKLQREDFERQERDKAIARARQKGAAALQRFYEEERARFPNTYNFA